MEQELNYRQLLRDLVRNVGSLGYCRGCGAQVFWVVHRNLKNVPYTADGLNHFIDCPKAEQFRKERKDGKNGESTGRRGTHGG